MLSSNSILDTFFKKPNFHTLVVSAVMCVVSLISGMLCCTVLYYVVPCSRFVLVLVFIPQRIREYIYIYICVGRIVDLLRGWAGDG